MYLSVPTSPAGAPSSGEKCRAWLLLGCKQHPPPSCDSAPCSTNTGCCPAADFNREKKKKVKKIKEERLCVQQL